MATASNEPGRPPAETLAETEVVTARLPSGDVERLDIAAARRGIGREEMISQAIDAFLAREVWSGGFIAPPPPMEIPGPYPWGPGAFGLRHRK
jgi:hypothetical protein